ncbi:MAG: hypothetical protein ABI277_09260 [Burkholderiaceae bacterium]
MGSLTWYSSWWRANPRAAAKEVVAYLHGLNDAFDLAQKTFERAFETLRMTPDIDRALVAECFQFRSDVADMRCDSKAALAHMNAALATLGEPKIEDRTRAITMRDSLGILLGRMGQSAAGAAEFRGALAELEDTGRERTQMAGNIQQDLALLPVRAGQRQAASEANRQALDIARGFGGVTPSLELQYSLGLIEHGRAHEAMPLIEHALAGAGAKGDRRSVAYIEIEGARAWCMTEEFSRCVEMMSTGRSELKALLPPGHTSFGNVALAQARDALAEFDHSEWLGSALVAQRMVQKARGQSTAAEASWQAALAELQAAAGDTATATIEARTLLAGR